MQIMASRLGLIFVIFSFLYGLSSCTYDRSNAASGVKLSANDRVVVSVSNAFSNFAVIPQPFTNPIINPIPRCDIGFRHKDDFVHSIAVVDSGNDDSEEIETVSFVSAMEKTSPFLPFLCLITVSISNCSAHFACHNLTNATLENRLEYFLIDVDTNKRFAYGVSGLFLFKFDLWKNEMVEFLVADEILSTLSFLPRALDVRDTWAIVLGYGYWNIENGDYGVFGCIIKLDSLANPFCMRLINESTYIISADITSHNDLYDLSVTVRGDKILMGIHRLNMIIFLEQIEYKLQITHTHQLSFSGGSSLGRGVAWADDTTIAVLASQSDFSAWSQSQIFFFDEKSITIASTLFVFPNNQQIVGSRLGNPMFVRFLITSQGHMSVLTDIQDLLLVPKAPEGHVSVWIETSALLFAFNYQPKHCIGGTFKNQSGLGPCNMCPPYTMNSGLLPTDGINCKPCGNNASIFCPLASLTEIDRSTLQSYSQATAYPDNPDSTDIEDILIQHVFSLSSDSRCLVISPLFWTIIVGSLCIVIWVAMVIIKRYDIKGCIKCRQNATKLLKHTDIIGEGEMLAGGLATFAIIVLIILSYRFLGAFLLRYPIEKIKPSTTLECDGGLTNSRYSTGLELLSLPKSDEARPIFKMLDEQIFVLTIELVNTGFRCEHIAVQENLSDKRYVRIIPTCVESISSAMTSIVFPLPKHFTDVQLKMTGPYSIGGFRLCIRGKGYEQNNYKLDNLDFCKSFYTENQTISRLTTVPISFMKKINTTDALYGSDSREYAGLWIPTFTNVEQTDEVYFVEAGQYVRFTSSSTIIQVTSEERAYYMRNIQKPIVRQGQLVFNGLLFASLCIEIFGLSFLFFKLFIVPILRRIVAAVKKARNREGPEPLPAPPPKENVEATFL